MPENPTFLERAKAAFAGTATAYIFSSIRNALLGSSWNVGIADPTFYVAEHASDEELRAGVQEQGIRNQESLDLWRQQRQYEFERQQLVNNDFVGEFFATLLDPVSWIAFGKAFQVLKFLRLTHRILVNQSLRTMKLVDTTVNAAIASGFESLVTDNTKAFLGNDPRFTPQSISINAAISVLLGGSLGAVTGAIRVNVMPSEGQLYKSKSISPEDFNKIKLGGTPEKFMEAIATHVLPSKSWSIKGELGTFILDGASTVKSGPLLFTINIKNARKDPDLVNNLAHFFNDKAELRVDTHNNVYLTTRRNGKTTILGKHAGEDYGTELRLVHRSPPIPRTAEDVRSNLRGFSGAEIKPVRGGAHIPKPEYDEFLLNNSVVRIAKSSGKKQHLVDKFGGEATVLTWGRNGLFPDLASVQNALENGQYVPFSVKTKYSGKNLRAGGWLIETPTGKHVLFLPDVKRVLSDAGIRLEELRISPDGIAEGGATLIGKLTGKTFVPEVVKGSKAQHSVNPEGLNVFDFPGYAKIEQLMNAQTLPTRPDVSSVYKRPPGKKKYDRLLKEDTKSLREYAARVQQGLVDIPTTEYLRNLGFFNGFTDADLRKIFSNRGALKVGDALSKETREKIKDNLINMQESLFSVKKLGKIGRENLFDGAEGLSGTQKDDIVRGVEEVLAKIHKNLNITTEQRNSILNGVNGSPEEKEQMLLAAVKWTAAMDSNISYIGRIQENLWGPTRWLDAMLRVINAPFDKSFGSLFARLTPNDLQLKRYIRLLTKQGGYGNIDPLMRVFFQIPVEDSLWIANQAIEVRTLPIWKDMQAIAKKSGLKEAKIKEVTVEALQSARGGTGNAAISGKDIVVRAGLVEGHEITKSVDALLVELRSKISDGYIIGRRNQNVTSVLMLDKLALANGMGKGGFLFNDMLDYVSNPSLLAPRVLRNARPDQRIRLLSKALLSEQRLDGLRNDFTQWLYKNNKQNLLRIIPNDPESLFRGTLRLDAHRQVLYKLMGTEDFDTAKMILGNVLVARGMKRFDIKVAQQRLHGTSGSPSAAGYGLARGNFAWRQALRNMSLVVGIVTLVAGGVFDILDGLYRTVITGSTLTTNAMAKPWFRFWTNFHVAKDGTYRTGAFNPDGTPEILNKKHAVKAFASSRSVLGQFLVEGTEGSGSFLSRAIQLGARFTNVLTLNAFTTSFILRYSANHFDEVMYKFAKVLRNGIDKGHITRNDILANNEAFKKYLLRETTANERSFASELGMTGEQVLQMGDDVTLAYGNLKFMKDLQTLDFDKLMDISPESGRLYIVTRNRVGQNAALFASAGERMPFLNPTENRILSQFVNFLQSAHFNRLNSALIHENGGLILAAITAHALLSTALVDGLIDIKEKNESVFYKKIQNSNDVKRLIHGLSESAIPGLFAYFAQPISVHLQTGQGVDRLFRVPSLERGLDFFGTFLTFGDNLEHKEPSQAVKKLFQDLWGVVPILRTIGYQLSDKAVVTFLDSAEDS